MCAFCARYRALLKGPPRGLTAGQEGLDDLRLDDPRGSRALAQKGGETVSDGQRRSFHPAEAVPRGAQVAHFEARLFLNSGCPTRLLSTGSACGRFVSRPRFAKHAEINCRRVQSLQCRRCICRGLRATAKHGAQLQPPRDRPGAVRPSPAASSGMLHSRVGRSFVSIRPGPPCPDAV